MVHGASFQEANAMAQSLVGPNDAFIHPFDDPLLWQGHASMIDEVARSGVTPDVVVLSVGGGGLLCGVVEGLRRQGWGHVPVIAVETTGADSLAQAMAANTRIELPAITSIATSLGARQVSEQAFALSQQHQVVSAVVSDQAAVQACLRGAGLRRIAGAGVWRRAAAVKLPQRAGDRVRRRDRHRGPAAALGVAVASRTRFTNRTGWPQCCRRSGTPWRPTLATPVRRSDRRSCTPAGNSTPRAPGARRSRVPAGPGASAC